MSVETVENIAKADQKNPSIAIANIANIAIMLIKSKEHNKFKNAHEP